MYCKVNWTNILANDGMQMLGGGGGMEVEINSKWSKLIGVGKIFEGARKPMVIIKLDKEDMELSPKKDLVL